MGVVLVEKQNGVAFIKMNRPEKLNALSTELAEGLISALKDAEKDPDVKVIILSGAGKAYSAGGDISSFKELKTAADTVSWIRLASEVTQTITGLEKYVVSAVHGFAAGAGFSIALASDFVIADRDAKFVSSFTNIGLVPDLGLIKQLVKHVPTQLAKEWISSGVRISAEEALDKGIVNRVVDGNVEEQAVEFSKFILDGPPLANRFVKYLVKHADELNETTHLMQENSLQTILLQTEDHKNAVQAFFNKEKPTFTGK